MPIISVAQIIKSLKSVAQTRGIFDVKFEGAIGDGIVNDADAINHAIANASARGGIVWFPPGKYRLGSGIVINSQVVLDGVGWSGDPDRNGSWLYVKDT